MKPADLIETMSAQNTARFQALWGLVEKMSDDQFDLPFEPDNLSVSHHIQLVVHEHERWLGFLEGDEDALYCDHEPSCTISKNELKRYWRSAHQRFKKYFESRSAQELNRTLEDLDGPIWEVLIHLMMISEEHYKYILTIVAHMGLSPDTVRPNASLLQYRAVPSPAVRPAYSMSH